MNSHHLYLSSKRLTFTIPIFQMGKLRPNIVTLMLRYGRGKTVATNPLMFNKL